MYIACNIMARAGKIISQEAIKNIQDVFLQTKRHSYFPKI